MQTILTYLTLLLTSLFLQAQNTINVDIEGFKNNKGKARVGLYNDKAQFLEQTFIGKDSKIADNKVQFSFNDIPDGTYAVSVYHDEDNDNIFNMYLGFIPKEDYGNSNNVPPRFGPPKWEDAKFEVRDGNVISILIKMM